MSLKIIRIVVFVITTPFILVCYPFFIFQYLSFLLKPFYKDRGSFELLLELNLINLFVFTSVIPWIKYEPRELDLFVNDLDNQMTISSNKNFSKTKISYKKMVEKINKDSLRLSYTQRGKEFTSVIIAFIVMTYVIGSNYQNLNLL